MIYNERNAIDSLHPKTEWCWGNLEDGYGLNWQDESYKTN